MLNDSEKELVKEYVRKLRRPLVESMPNFSKNQVKAILKAEKLINDAIDVVEVLRPLQHDIVVAQMIARINHAKFDSNDLLG